VQGRAGQAPKIRRKLGIRGEAAELLTTYSVRETVQKKGGKYLKKGSTQSTQSRRFKCRDELSHRMPHR